MSTTTVRLDHDDEHLLDKLAITYGGRSNAIRQALRQLAAEADRHEALDGFLEDWQRDAGPIDEAAVEAMAARYGL
jgi:Arc/MetJ-type ribon-helix-helix transcriptional regulator